MPANQGCNLLPFERQPCFNELCCQRPIWPRQGRFLRTESVASDRRHLQGVIIKISIDMKTSCEACERALPADLEAYICSFECTFCSDCAASTQFACPNCGGELLRRPRRKTPSGNLDDGPRNLLDNRPWLIWAVSIGVWSFIAFAATLTVYQLYRSTNSPTPFLTVLGMQVCQILTYAPLTPFAFAFALRYPIHRENWVRRSLLYLAAGLVFTMAHVALRAITPYAFWDPRYRDWGSAVWDSHAHLFKIQWLVLRRQFFSSMVDDITGTFVPIVLVAHAVSYYRRFRERELRAAQLEGQLAKAHLQTLKSQLQPHFLFNTMHSISSLMLSDVQAADRMMTRLGDLLRMSLEAAGTQIATLSRELEFVNCYLEIEKVRFAERLTVILEIAPETLDASGPSPDPAAACGQCRQAWHVKVIGRRGDSNHCQRPGRRTPNRHTGQRARTRERRHVPSKRSGATNHARAPGVALRPGPKHGAAESTRRGHGHASLHSVSGAARSQRM